MSVNQYLSRYSEAEVSHIEALTKKLRALQIKSLYSHILCIPCFDEPVSNIRSFTDFVQQQNTLLVLVLNEPSNTSSTDNTVACHEYLLQLNTTKYTLENLTFIPLESAGILLIERTNNTQGIKNEHGVGLARKIAADVALYLIQNKYIHSKWIHCSDADARLPDDYFTAAKEISNKQHFAAITYPFSHIADSSDNTGNIVLHATKLYEKRLHQYKNGLKSANSPYAFHALGSIIAIHYDYYAKARGFPKRPGGEDFYLLNKLRKLGKIHEPKSPTITIHARESQRAPFGTGKSIALLLKSESILDYPMFYNPNIFSMLRHAISWLNNAYDEQNLLKKSAYESFQADLTRSITTYLSTEKPKRLAQNASNTSNAQHSSNVAMVISEAFISIGITAFFQHSCKQCKNLNTYQEHAFQWFDGFKTLKWIHSCERQGFEKLSNNALKQHFGTA